MKHWLDKSHNQEQRLPELVKSDVESDDCNSLPDCSDNELGGGNVIEAQQDHFADHPTPTKLEFDKELLKKCCLWPFCHFRRKFCLKRKLRGSTGSYHRWQESTFVCTLSLFARRETDPFWCLSRSLSMMYLSKAL